MMPKNTLLALLALVSSLTLSSNIYHQDNTHSESFISENGNKAREVEDTSVTMGEIAIFLKTKNEHYPMSDEFIERYQQNSGGYIAYAKSLGLPVNRAIHEPNQKWHFFDSWYDRSIDDGSIKNTDDARQRVYINLQCPELLLWIYEACAVSPSKVYDAKKIAEAGKAAGTLPITIAKNMRTVVAWEDLARGIKGI